MAHESFEDADVAAVMNRYFVNIKVDREERPDLDEIYMQATMILNQGQGGWPMSVWLTPELKPFFAGTYFPPASKWGRPGFGELCERIGQLWNEKREAIESDAERLSDVVRRSFRIETAGAAQLSLEAIDAAARTIGNAFDAERGGLSSGGNKFPPSMAMELILRSAVRTRTTDPAGSRTLIERVQVTLDRMAAGGIYDQLGGGICRYSTDPDWLVPHFEKMLYDQALVSRIYIDAWLVTRQPSYARVARDIFDYVVRDLQAPGGGFYSSRDADSEGQEGKFYVWTRDEVLAALGREDGELFCSFYDVSEAGNWEDPHQPGVVKNILHAPRSIEVVSKLNRIDAGELEQRLAAARLKLREVRDRRTAPGRDQKILCEWNGLMISSLARGGAALDERNYVDAAARAANFILTQQYENGRLRRSWLDGRRLEAAFLSDYACMIEGLLDLYEATFERRWLEAAVALNSTVVELYWDADAGGFFFTPRDHETLLARTKQARDSAVPSGNSVQLSNLLRLSVMLGDARLREMADRMLSAFSADVLASLGSSERFLASAEFALAGPIEIAFVGDPRNEATRGLIRAARNTWLPNRVLMLVDPALADQSPTSPLLAGRTLLDGRPAAYICRNYACQRPVTGGEELRAQLAASGY
jgi:hypothetical protein